MLFSYYLSKLCTTTVNASKFLSCDIPWWPPHLWYFIKFLLFTGRKMLPWKILSLAESTDHNPGWDPSDETDPERFAMIVTVFARIEFSREFYDIDSPKYPLFMDMSHDYLRRTSKCCKMSLCHPDSEEPYVVMYSIDVKLDSETRKPKPYPASWQKFGIPSEPSKSMKHSFPDRPENGVFYTEHKIHYSDTDANHHANYTFYVRACYDSFVENITKKNFPDSSNALMDAGVKTLEVTYKQEAFMGDVITVASWVGPKCSNVYYFELLDKSQICTLVTFEFHLPEQDGSQHKGRLWIMKWNKGHCACTCT